MRRRLAAGLGLALLVGACEGGPVSIGGGGDGATVDGHVAHPSGVVLQVLGVRTSGDKALVRIKVMNGRDREVRLNPGRDNSYLVGPGGEKLLLVASPTNSAMAVPPGKIMDGELVFSGALPSSGKATLVLNENGSADSEHSSTPRFQVDLPLDGARGAIDAAASSFANMQPLAETRLAPAQGGGSALGPGGASASSFEAVAKLKSELGAVETERGTMVSLPGDVTFDFDKATIRTDAQGTLDRLAQLIAAGGSGAISIEGHAKDDDAYNKKLSEARAGAVKTYLAGKGVDAARMHTIGLGELRPAAPNAKSDGSDDEAGRQRNRRVEVILPNGADPTPTPSRSGAAKAS